MDKFTQFCKKYGIEEKAIQYKICLKNFLEQPTNQTLNNLKNIENAIANKDGVYLAIKNKIIELMVELRYEVAKDQLEKDKNIKEGFDELDKLVAHNQEYESYKRTLVDAILFVSNKYMHYLDEDGNDKSEQYFDLLNLIDEKVKQLDSRIGELCGSCDREECVSPYDTCYNLETTEVINKIKFDLMEMKEVLKTRFGGNFNESMAKKLDERARNKFDYTKIVDKFSVEKDELKRADFGTLLAKISDFVKGGELIVNRIDIDKIKEAYLDFSSFLMASYRSSYTNFKFRQDLNTVMNFSILKYLVRDELLNVDNGDAVKYKNLYYDFLCLVLEPLGSKEEQPAFLKDFAKLYGRSKDDK